MVTNVIVLPPFTVTVEHKVEETFGGVEVVSVEVGIATIHKGTLIGGGPWKTGLDSVAELRREGSKIVAMYYNVDEYGIGDSSEEALADLLVSLVDYRASLEKRENRLAAKEQSDLASLKTLLEK
jgi:hypothetical protein